MIYPVKNEKVLPSLSFCPWHGFKSGQFQYQEAGYRSNTFSEGKQNMHAMNWALSILNCVRYFGGTSLAWKQHNFNGKTVRNYLYAGIKPNYL
jgi:hypothetical protein